MSVTPIDTIKPGQRVKWQSGGGSGLGSAFSAVTKRGEVARVTPSTVLIRPDSYANGADLVRLNANRRGQVDLQILTPHELALEGWLQLRPTTEAVTISTGDSRYGLTDPAAKLTVHLDDRNLRAAVMGGKMEALEALGKVRAEAETLARWVFERPEPPVEDEGLTVGVLLGLTERQLDVMRRVRAAGPGWYRAAGNGERVTLASLHRRGLLKRQVWRGTGANAAHEYAIAGRPVT